MDPNPNAHAMIAWVEVGLLARGIVPRSWQCQDKDISRSQQGQIRLKQAKILYFCCFCSNSVKTNLDPSMRLYQNTTRGCHSTVQLKLVVKTKFLFIFLSPPVSHKFPRCQLQFSLIFHPFSWSLGIGESCSPIPQRRKWRNYIFPQISPYFPMIPRYWFPLIVQFPVRYCLQQNFTLTSVGLQLFWALGLFNVDSTNLHVA